MSKLADEGDVYGDPISFARFNYINQTLWGPFATGISLEEFNHGNTIMAFSAATANTPTGICVPTTRSGTGRVKVKFSGPIPLALEMIVYAQYPTLIEIDSSLTPKTSYRV